MSVKKNRQLNYELLRIIAMLMIVCLHYLGKGGLLPEPSGADMNAVGYMAWLIEAFCLVSVNVYVLISGYFGVDSISVQTDENPISFRKVLRRPCKIWHQVLFYSLTIGCIALLIGAQEFDLYQFFSYCFPIVTEHYWFASAYVVLCLLMPFLNAGFSRLRQKEIEYLLAGLLLVFSISKTVLPMQLPWDKDGYDVLWFVILYLTGAYLKRYEWKFLKDRWKSGVLYLGSTAVIFASFFFLRLLFLKTGRLEKMINYGYSYNFFTCYTGAVGLFLTFRQEKESPWLERFRKPIELFSGAAFGVYLIHEHVNLRYEWPKWLKCENQLQNSIGGFLIHMLLSVLCVYLVCTAIEFVRQKVSALLFGRRK
ncbi:MAG: acyltransferase [Lachnospiraceae bacterium]|nr:acyltransferase [Lachnospiraceae bacterium]